MDIPHLVVQSMRGLVFPSNRISDLFTHTPGTLHIALPQNPVLGNPQVPEQEEYRKSYLPVRRVYHRIGRQSVPCLCHLPIRSVGVAPGSLLPRLGLIQ